MLDAGQCNDSYSLAVIALKLKEIFGLDDINDLPIVYNIAGMSRRLLLYCWLCCIWRQEYSSRSYSARFPQP